MRVFNWDHKLVQFAEEVRSQPYEWGETDCASLVMRAMEVIYGERRFDHLPDWNTEIGAKRALNKIESIDIALKRAGGEEQDVNFKQSGDVVVGIDNNEHFPGLGVVVDTNMLTSNPDRGPYLIDYHKTNIDTLYRL